MEKGHLMIPRTGAGFLVDELDSCSGRSIERVGDVRCLECHVVDPWTLTIEKSGYGSRRKWFEYLEICTVHSQKPYLETVELLGVDYWGSECRLESGDSGISVVGCDPHVMEVHTMTRQCQRLVRSPPLAFDEPRHAHVTEGNDQRDHWGHLATGEKLKGDHNYQNDASSCG